MSRKHVRRATPKEMSLVLGNVSSIELLDNDNLNELCETARHRIITVFLHAEMTVRRRPTADERSFDNGFQRKPPPRTRLVQTDNYIVGLDGKSSELAQYVHRHMSGHFIGRRTFERYPELNWVLEINQTLAEKFILQLEHQVILDEIGHMMRGTESSPQGEIWFDQNHGGIWQITQSCIDEHLKQLGPKKPRIKDDRRNEHGQVRSQRKARGRPAGASTSHAGDSTIF